MNNKLISTVLLSGVVACGFADNERKISIAEYIDKMEAGWIGQTVGLQTKKWRV